MYLIDELRIEIYQIWARIPENYYFGWTSDEEIQKQALELLDSIYSEDNFPLYVANGGYLPQIVGFDVLARDISETVYQVSSLNEFWVWVIRNSEAIVRIRNRKFEETYGLAIAG